MDDGIDSENICIGKYNKYCPIVPAGI